jgi:hypothetical protein
MDISKEEMKKGEDVRWRSRRRRGGAKKRKRRRWRRAEKMKKKKGIYLVTVLPCE